MNYSKLKDAIKGSRLQRKDIALKAHVTPKTIDNIIAGADLKVSTLESIAKAVGIKISMLFDEEENIAIRNAGRDYVEKGKIEHKGTEYNAPVTNINSDLEKEIAELRKENTELKHKLISTQEKIIELMDTHQK